MTEFFAQPDETAEPRASELHTSLGEQLGAEASEAFMSSTRSLMRASQYLGAEHGVDPMAALGAADAGVAGMQVYDNAMKDAAAEPDVPIADAKARVQQEKLEPFVKLPDQGTIRGPVLDLMLEDARDRQRYAAAVNRGPSGFIPGALGFATQIGAGMIDPTNIAAFSIPVLGEARYGKLMASAGESILGRAAIRTGVGAAQGAVGGAALAPADWWLHTQDGQDYTMADALKSVVLSGGMGAVAHGAGGLIGDVYSRLRGRPLEGAPLSAAANVPDYLLSSTPGEAVGEEAPGVAPPAETVLPPEAAEAADRAVGLGAGVEINGRQWRHPAEVLADLPPTAREDVVRASIADVINGEPVRAGELLEEAAKADPRVAESLEGRETPRETPSPAAGAVRETGHGETVPGPAPGMLRTGRPQVDAVLADPVVAEAIANGPVNRGNDVPYEAGASEGADPTTNLDKHLPRVAELPSGGTFDPAVPAKIHEQVEKRVMQLLIAKKETELGRKLKQPEIDAIYETAHHEFAEPAEDAWYRQQGLPIDEVNAWWAKQDKITEHEHPVDPPANLYRKPYPHNVVEGVKHEEKGAALEWPTKAAPEGATLPGRPAAAVRPLPAAPPGRGPRSKPEERWSLTEFLAHRGGIDPNDPLISDLRGSIGRSNKFVPGFGHLIRKGGMRLDRAREAAIEAGYLPDEGFRSDRQAQTTPSDLLDAIDQELRGQKVYREGIVPDRTKPEFERADDEARYHADQAFAEALEEIGADRSKVPDSTYNRVLELMTREGVDDPVAAYERAILEEDHNATEAGELKPGAAKIAGWNDDNVGAEQGAGAGAAGGPEREGAAARRPIRAAGADAGRADWAKLAARRDAAGDLDEILGASSEADKAEPPPETPEKFVSAAEQAAADAEKLLADILPNLTDAEREKFETALADLKNDRSAREQMLRDAASCLMTASA